MRDTPAVTLPAWPFPSPLRTDICSAAQAASRRLATLPTAEKDAALLAIADALEARTVEILEANARDLEAGREAGLSDALLDRLLLDPERIAAIAAQVRDIAALPDPVGEVIDGFRLPNGLDVRQDARRRSASSGWSTRPARTSRSTPPPCA